LENIINLTRARRSMASAKSTDNNTTETTVDVSSTTSGENTPATPGTGTVTVEELNAFALTIDNPGEIVGFFGNIDNPNGNTSLGFPILNIAPINVTNEAPYVLLSDGTTLAI
jgi:hypothetical protein